MHVRIHRVVLHVREFATDESGFNHLPIVGEHAAKVKELLPIHKDPFDRLLVAQARFEPMIC